MDFDFLTEQIDEETQPKYVGPNMKSAVKMTPRKFASSVLEVFDKLGGVSWLLIEAQADPKAFLALLSKMIPKSVQLDDLAGIAVTVVDQFGRQVKAEAVNANNQTQIAATIPSEGTESGQLQIATGGSQTPRAVLSSSPGESPPTDVDITDIFKKGVDDE